MLLEICFVLLTKSNVNFTGYKSWLDLPWSKGLEDQKVDQDFEDVEESESNVRVKRAPFLPVNPFEGKLLQLAILDNL